MVSFATIFTLSDLYFPMLNNDFMRRLRYALDLNDDTMLAIFKQMGNEIEQPFLKAIMTKEGEPGFIECRDSQLCQFLDGLIVHNRGLREGAEIPQPQKRINNNEILQKLRIALELRTEDIIDILKLANFRMSKGELGALFRKPDHRNFKACGDQVIRNFLTGLTKRNRS